MARRILFGVVESDGKVMSPTDPGFTVKREEKGKYRVEFDADFSQNPSVVVTIAWEGELNNHDVYNGMAGTARVTKIWEHACYVKCWDNDNDHRDQNFSIQIIGV